MSQQDKAKSRTKKAHELSHALKRDKPHRAVIKGRKVAKKHAAKAQRRVDKQEVRLIDDVVIRDVKDSFKALPARARLTWARAVPADPPPEALHLPAMGIRLAVEELPPKKVVLCLEYSEPGWGFGTFTITQTPDGVFVDTECTSLARVRKAIDQLLDGAIIDHATSKKDHARFNKATGTRCGPACRICNPERKLKPKRK